METVIYEEARIIVVPESVSTEIVMEEQGVLGKERTQVNGRLERDE